MGFLINDIAGVLHVFQSEVRAAGHVHDHAPCAFDGGFEQRAGDRLFRSVLRLFPAFRLADAHMGGTRILHYGGNVCKVEIDEARELDQLGNGLDPLAEDIVRHFKGIQKGDFLFRYQMQAVVRNDHDAVYLSGEIFNALFRLGHAALAFKGEGLRYDANGEDTELLCDLRHHGSRACAGAAAHACSDKYHIGAF